MKKLTVRKVGMIDLADQYILSPIVKRCGKSNYLLLCEHEWNQNMRTERILGSMRHTADRGEPCQVSPDSFDIDDSTFSKLL